ncbi:hypothetical protein A0128_14075 [Leptospira tipperaryensis]|uniref:Lipoprotein n=1 Tax=Leptospira tipperaryensis TaxID=2564040 RepID=A0A1D7UZ72_9LEPT|nr:hypothetical protein [Leptospira tipperaryensis]AOP34874.1 hypothetical protein A0128_14075 [Leptospira tipperaryensis]
MLLKKISVALVLALFFAQCNSKGNSSSDDQNLLLLAAIAPKNPGVSGLYASLNLNNGGGGGAGNYSNGSVSPFVVVSQTQNCPRGGSATVSGDITFNTVGATTTIQLNGVKAVYTSCSFIAPLIESSENSSTVVLLDGELLQDFSLSQTVDPSSTASLYKVTASGTQRLRSSNYKVNGYLFPTFDVTFTRNNSKLTLENMSDLDNAYISVDETVHVSGTIGTETISKDYSYKSRYRFK